MKHLFSIFTLCVLTLAIAAPLQAKDKFLKSKGQELGYREAGSFANNAEKRDIMVGAEFLSKSEQKRLLGDQSSKFAVLEVAISNNSRFRLYVNDIALVDGGNQMVLEDVSLDDVAKATGPSGSGNKNAMRLSILRNNLIDKSLQASVVLPGETIQGLVFARNKGRGQGLELRVDIQNLKRLVYLDVVVPLDQ